MAGSKVPTVEVVVINYKRQDNIPLILRRFREQSHPCTITLVDHGGGLSMETHDLAHRTYTLWENYGPWSRFVPAGNYHCDYTYFHDDDMLPGRDVVKNLLAHAENTPDGALFGQFGRMCKNRFNTSGLVTSADLVVPVSMVIRGYFLKTKYLWVLLKFVRYFKHPVTEDDILLAWSIYTYTNKLIYVTPRSANPFEFMNEEELPTPFACCERPGHYQIREKFWLECEVASQRAKSEETL